MEDLQTSSEASPVEATADSGSVETVDTTATTTASATADAAASQGESPTPSGSVTESQGEITNLSEGVSNESERLQSEFDPYTWDGNLDSLPVHLKGPVSFLHRQLESGYTKKFQTLADERKAFEAKQADFKKSGADWKTEKETLSGELDLLRRIIGGEEDPRIAQITGEHDKLSHTHTQLQQEFEHYKKAVQSEIERDAQVYADKFMSEYSDIFEDDDKRGELISLLDADWSPEIAVKLVGLPSNVTKLAAELKSKGMDEALAIEHATLKLGGGEAQRQPRPGARMTSGAESRNNPESIRKDITHANNNREARSLAAKAAMEWQARNRVS